MTLTIVLSGPRASESQARTTLASAGFDVHPADHDHGLPPDVSGKKVREPQAFITVHDDDIDRAHDTVSPLGWRLRLHHDRPEPEPPAAVDQLLAKFEEYDSRLSRLERELRNPPMMGGAVESPPAFLQASSYGAEITRRMTTALLQRGATVGSITGGLVNSADMQLTPPGSGMSVNVGTGEAFVAGTNSATQGGYYCRVSSSTNLAISASDPTNPRIDTVVGQVQDAAYAGGINSFTVGVVTGTPTGGANLTNLTGVGAAPASSLVLGYVLAPALATNIVGGDLSNVAVGVQGQVAQREWAYAQITVTTAVTDTSESTATAIITAPTFTPDGGPVIVEFFAPFVNTPLTATGTTTVTLFEGATQICRLALVQNSGGTSAVLATPTVGRYRFTPTAAAHTYKVCGFVSATTGTPSIGAGVTGTGAYAPAFVRFTKV